MERSLTRHAYQAMTIAVIDAMELSFGLHSIAYSSYLKYEIIAPRMSDPLG